MTLEHARNAADAALDEVRVAKLEFFETPTEQKRDGVAAAERKLADARLDLERAQHSDRVALANEEARDRAVREEELAALQATDRERQEKIDDALLELVEFERQAHALIGRIEEITKLRQGAFARRKQLSLSLDRSTVEKAPPTATETRIALAIEIRRARVADGRDNTPSDVVTGWLAPSLRLPLKVGA